MKQILNRIKSAYNCLFRYDHFLIVSIKRSDLIEMFKGQEFEVNGYSVALHEYNYKFLIKHMAEAIDEDEMLLLKAQFEVEAELHEG